MIARLWGLVTCRMYMAVCQIALLLAAFLSATAILSGQGQGEYSVKAAFLLNFARYTDWPPSAFVNSTSPLVLCVIGADPFGAALDVIDGKSVRGRPLRIERHGLGGALRSCHLAFISDSERPGIDALLKTADAASTLTISDIDRFARRGGIIGLFVEGDRVRFEVNVRAAERARLKLSSNLLKLATLVRQ